MANQDPSQPNGVLKPYSGSERSAEADKRTGKAFDMALMGRS